METPNKHKINGEEITLPIGEIKPYWRNPRDNKAAIEEARKSIEEMGYLQNIVVDKDNTIIVGHSRWKALQLLGWEQVPVTVANLDDKKAKKYRIIDNKVGEAATWVMDDLMTEMREIGVEEMAMFFPELDIQTNLDSLAGVGHKTPTEAQVNKQQEKNEGQFSKLSQDRTDNLVDMICPECGEEFQVSRATLLDILKSSEEE